MTQGEQHQGRAMAACCDCAFALFGTVWHCVVLCGLCGAVWTVWCCVDCAVLCGPTVCATSMTHGTACQGSCRPSFSLRRDYNFSGQGLRQTVSAGENKLLLGAGLSFMTTIPRVHCKGRHFWRRDVKISKSCRNYKFQRHHTLRPL